MKADALTPRDLFDITICYEIPSFQRPYVWSEEDQWQPLWDDIVREVEAYLDAPAVEGAATPAATPAATGHFLDAGVVKQLSSQSADP